MFRDVVRRERELSTRHALAEPWCDATCPRQQTHMWTDCECGGARREFDHYRDQHERARRR